MLPYKTPGVFIQEIAPSVGVGLRTGVPGFLGYAGVKGAGQPMLNTPVALTLWSQYQAHFITASASYLSYAVRGFFENGGRLCYVVLLDEMIDAPKALMDGLAALAAQEAAGENARIDLVCAPDIMRPVKLTPVQMQPPDPDQVQAMQTAVLNHCDGMGDRFAILDSLPGLALNEVLAQRSKLSGTNGALYYPWIRVEAGPAWNAGFTPPCGHVAGVYASTDERTGVFKSPANEALNNVLDLETDLSHAQQESLNPAGVNCLRAFPGRGIRVWGARTLSNDSAWTYISVRRLFLTAVRWIDHKLASVLFEPNDAQLWARIERDLTTYFLDLFRRGALMGQTPQEAFFVKCDATTNPPEARQVGTVVTEIGLAPARPSEFIVVRIIQKASGATIAGPSTPI